MSTRSGQLQVYYHQWMEMFWSWGFLPLIGVDRDEQNRGQAALAVGLAGPVTGLLTLRQGVICAGTAAIIHPHRPVTSYKHPCWCKQRKLSPLTTVLKGPLCCSHLEDVTSPWPATSDMCPPSDRGSAQLGRRRVLKVGQCLRYNGMKCSLKKNEKKRERVMSSRLWSLVKSAHLRRGPASGFLFFWSANFIFETGSTILRLPGD